VQIRRLASLVIAVSLALLTTRATGAPQSRATHAPTQGADISWPNCPKGEGIPTRRTRGKPLPKPSAHFVVIGLTNGPGFYPNPCIASQLQWVRAHHRMLAA
jgi:hypothetical protein